MDELNNDTRTMNLLKVVVPIGLFLLAQTTAAVWWASSQTERTNFMAEQIGEQKILVQALVNRPDLEPLQNQIISENQKMISDLRTQTTTDMRDLRDRVLMLERNDQAGPKP